MHLPPFDEPELAASSVDAASLIACAVASAYRVRMGNGFSLGTT
jgi:hypothetical protein